MPGIHPHTLVRVDREVHAMIRKKARRKESKSATLRRILGMPPRPPYKRGRKPKPKQQVENNGGP